MTEFEDLSRVVGDVGDTVSDLAARVLDLENRVSALEGSTPDEDDEEEEVPTPSTQAVVGTSVRFISGKTWPRLISEAENLLGGFTVRRCYDSGMPATFDRANIRHDHRPGRLQAWSFKMPSTVTVQQVERLLRSVPLKDNVWVIPWHEPVDNMPAAEYRRRYDIVYQAYLNVGGFRGIGTCLTNWTIKRGHRSNGPGLAYVQPEKSTFLSVDFYGDLETSRGAFPLPRPVDSMELAINYANSHGLELAVDEFGADYNQSKGNPAHIRDQASWIRSFTELGRVATVSRLCYWNGSDAITNSLLTNHPSFIPAWQDLRNHYENR